MLGTGSTTICRASRTCTTGPLRTNRPVRLTASRSEPPPLLRRSRISPETFSLLNAASCLATSTVALRNPGWFGRLSMVP
ncbi:MAG: hypothetical protein BWX70_02925 [Verrucomicrobia bacterium ADurb.Bin070]|nr:MAG: hypothetical protein BWX70_02925 [Verrucomicrobia bacterium ADurb.Bin070]